MKKEGTTSPALDVADFAKLKIQDNILPNEQGCFILPEGRNRISQR